MSYYHTPRRGRAPAADFFPGSPRGTKIHQKPNKTHVRPQVWQSVASKWPRGGARDAKVLQTLPQGAKKCQFGAPRVAQTLKMWCFTVRKHSFSQNPQIRTFDHFWHRFCSRGPQKWCKRCPGGGHGCARGGHPDAKGAKRYPKR